MTDRSRRENIRKYIILALVAFDAIAFALAWLSAWGTRVLLSGTVGRDLNPGHIYWNSLPLIVCGALLTAAVMNSYSGNQQRSNIEQSLNIARVSFGNLLVVMSLGFLIKEYDYSRTLVLLFGLYSLLFLTIFRYIYKVIQSKLIDQGLLELRVLIVGAGSTGIRAVQKVQDQPGTGYNVVGFLDDDPEKQGKQLGKAAVLGTLSQLREISESEQIDEIIIAIPELDSEDMMQLLMTIDDLGVRVRVIADLFGVLSHETNIDVIEDIPIYLLHGPSASFVYTLGKRIFDLTVGIIFFTAFMLTLPFIAVAIRIDSKGPIFFVQERVGLDGKRFKMWKYRTMFSDTDSYAIAPKNKRDSRITKVGRFLRQSSLDELPQIINVMLGNMSLVGPRPEMPFIVETYNEWQMKRLEVKPGITGLWQILGRKDLPLHENLEYDFYYIKNRSLLLDLTILLKTIPAALFGKGAY